MMSTQEIAIHLCRGKAKAVSASRLGHEEMKRWLLKEAERRKSDKQLTDKRTAPQRLKTYTM